MRQKLKRITKWFLMSIVALLLIYLFRPTWTPSINGSNSISLYQSIEINGAAHQLMIRGEDRANPIIIFVHGGPGTSEIPYVRKYQKQWEKDYTIVHYDQRGSGKSFQFGKDYSRLTTDDLVDDLLALTDYIRNELQQSKVILIGHSFGTYIGLKAAAKEPDKFHAYVGVGQVADTRQSELDAWNYLMTQAKFEHNKEDMTRIEALYESISQGKAYAPRDLLRKYGGAARLIDDNGDYFQGFVTSTEYNGLDLIRFILGVEAIQEQLLNEEADHALSATILSVELPIYFVMGQYDYMTSTNVANVYFDQLDAPEKHFVEFEHSAHYPQFEEQNRFHTWLNETFKDLSLH